MGRDLLALFISGILAAAALGQQPQPSKRIPASVTVQSEGLSGLVGQSASDLTKPQLQELDRLIRSELARDDSWTLVGDAESAPHLRIRVVAAQSGPNLIVASSAITLTGQGDGAEKLGTHDVIACLDLQSAARMIALQAVRFKLQVSLRLFK